MPCPTSLIQAYLDTAYRIVDVGIVIRVDQCNPALELWLDEHAATHWAFISASNPGSIKASKEDNQLRHQQLIEACKPYQIFDGLGEPDLADSWPAESSVMVLNITQNEALNLCRRFEQNAIVYGTAGQPAQLLFNPNIT